MAHNTATGFSVRNWAAWAPGLECRQDWLDWCHKPYLPAGETAPAAAHLPPLLKRRTLRLGRMALEALAAVARDLPAATPVVFASRHGETLRSLGLIRELLAEGSVSPQSFSLSVHNATVGIHTIALGSHANVTALAGGQATGDALLTEAMGLLFIEAESVLVVACDETLPDSYLPYTDEPQAPFAWAAELVRGDEFFWSEQARPFTPEKLPELLATLFFLIAPDHQTTAFGHWLRQGAMPAC